MKYQIIMTIGLLLLGLVGCKPKSQFELVETDFGGKGLPLRIKAPANAKLESVPGPPIDLFTIRDEASNYGISFEAQDILAGTSVESEKANLLATAKGTGFFSKVIKEESNGFVYENKMSETDIRYSFGYVLFKGDKMYTAQADPSLKLTQAQAEELFEAVKQ